MSDSIRNRAREVVERIKALPEDVRTRNNLKGRAHAEAEHRAFQEHFRTGKCSICGDDLTFFDANQPCVHWLLMPPGFTKHHFMHITACYSLFQIQAFLRWVANEDGFARNINDLSDEGTGKLVELTIRHGECEWAFSCGQGDYLGHECESEHSRRPHYHFQMRYKRGAFIRYGDFHIPLWEMDIATIEAKRIAPDFIFQRFAGGEGMNDVLSDETVEHIVQATVPAMGEDDATFNIQTMIMADAGTQISGDDLAALFQEAEEKKVTMASLIPKLKNVTAQTLVSPAPGVVEQAPRSGRRGGNRKKK